jgi:hypothetical protein
MNPGTSVIYWDKKSDDPRHWNLMTRVAYARKTARRHYVWIYLGDDEVQVLKSNCQKMRIKEGAHIRINPNFGLPFKAVQ